MGVLPRRAVRATSGPSIWLALAFGLDAIIAVIAILIGRSLNLAELLAAGPLLACARCGGRMTALVAGYAIALCAIVTGVIGASSVAIHQARRRDVKRAGVAVLSGGFEAGRKPGVAAEEVAEGVGFADAPFRGG
jgi:hypothetical protein